MRRPCGWLLVLLWVVTPLLAQDIPPPLRDWQSWVLHDVPQHACPFLANASPGSDSYQCAWPGRMQLQAGQDGGHFALAVHVDAASWVALPGDAHNWPQQVVVASKPLTVLMRGNQPEVWLEPGDYLVQGQLPWQQRPARLRVPEAIGLVSLQLDGAAVNRIERHGDQLTLGEAAAAQRAADALSLRVYRRLSDGLPATLDTELHLDVAGSAREQLLGPALPKGFVATSLQGVLPVRLESDGRLRIQLRPGYWTIRLGARADSPLAKVALTLPAAPWPRQEIWSYADNGAWRSSRVEGRPVDADQAEVPSAWHELPAYALDDSSGLSIVQGVRAGEAGKDDQLRLRRELWLDFDGVGLDVTDQLSGQLHHQQRLDVKAPWSLQRADLDDQPLLVTRDASGNTGVELRSNEIELHAGLRLPDHRGRLPSNGWQVPLDGIDAVLHLPPGYRLLGAPGADRSPDSWLAQWSLLDLFVVALIALLAGRLLSWPWGLLTFGFLALSQHESGAPRWTLLAALALLLAMRALPAGRLRQLLRIGAFAVMLLVVLHALPFASMEAEYALHPQLEHSRERVLQVAFKPPGEMVEARQQMQEDKAQRRDEAPAQPEAAAPAPAPPAPPADIAASAPVSEATSQVDSYASKGAESARKLETVTLTDSAIRMSDLVSQVTDSRSVVQAGPGQPRWAGNRYQLGWSGPVTPQQSVRLLIAPSWLVRLLRVTMLLLLLALLARLLRDLVAPWQGRWRASHAGAPVALLALVLLPAIWSPPTQAQGSAQAQPIPDSELLRVLHARLLEPPKCVPACAAIPTATVQAHGDSILLQLEVHAGAAVALPLPVADQALSLNQVVLDGHTDAPLVRYGGEPVVRLEAGVHHLDLHYLADGTDNVSLRFALLPQRMVFSGPDWTLGGVDDGRVLGDSVDLSRTRAAGNGAADVVKQTFPPYVRLTRSLVLGLDWTVENTVERIAPKDGGFSISLPLLPGEHPQGDGLRIQDGRIGITFTAQDSSVSWTSKLDRGDRLQLTAPVLGERAERWEVHASPIWHVVSSGVPMVVDSNGLDFQPLPGEQLQLAVTQPAAVAGDSLAFDEVELSHDVGEHASEATLTLKARSTRGGEHAIGLPDGASLLQASRDGATLDLAAQNGKLSLPLLPGEHSYTLRLRLAQGIAPSARTPLFALGVPAANLNLQLNLPQDRWILWTWGPTQGPAVLYWSQLVVLLLVAWLLARYAPTPLRFRHWLLLGLGFSAFAWSAYALVVLWLILLGLRARLESAGVRDDRLYNLIQLGLAALSAIALLVLISAVPEGLLGQPDMHVTGPAGGSRLSWFADQTADVLPQGGVFSIPLWVYKLAMLAWALWLANALIGWLRWGFAAWMQGGHWRRRVVPVPLSEPTVESTNDGA